MEGAAGIHGLDGWNIWKDWDKRRTRNMEGRKLTNRPSDLSTPRPSLSSSRGRTPERSHGPRFTGGALLGSRSYGL
jgi:hypothetical protein